MNDFEKDLKKAYEKGTQVAADKKDAVWDAVSRELEDIKVSRKKHRKHNKIGLIAVAAAALLVVLSAFTPAGQAAVAKIIDFFAPQKQVETNLEGQTEEHEYQLHTPKVTYTPMPETTPDGAQKDAMTYAMYIDETRYEAKTVDGIDIITPIDFPENYPEVSLAIYQNADDAPTELVGGLYKEISEQYDTVYEPEEVEYPLAGTHLMAHDGLLEGKKEDLVQWDSPVIDIYLLDNTQGGTFVITLKYFSEAAEGHAERLKGMVNELTIIPVQ